MTERPYKTRLKQLRAALQALGLDGFIVPHSDEYQNEFVPVSAERLAFISGFTGSAGYGLILARQAALLTDGRYTLQAQQQTDDMLIMTERAQCEDWLRANLPAKKRCRL